jgi:hypothetical protein
MKRCNYLADGYTQPGFLKGVPNLFEDLRFTFRPAVVEERSQILTGYSSSKADAFDRKVAQFLAQKIKSWDVVDQYEQDVAVSAAAILRLPPELFQKVWQVVGGFEACDTDPNWPDETIDRTDAEQLESALSGSTVGEVREALDAKN